MRPTSLFHPAIPTSGPGRPAENLVTDTAVELRAGQALPPNHANRFQRRLRCIALAGALLLPAGLPSASAEEHEHGHDHSPAPASLARALQPARSADTKPVKLPRLPEGVTELKFGDFFVRPIGPRGLELTDKLRGLDGQRVRILGYMAQEESPVPGRLLLAAIPVQIHSHDNSLADDLPPAVLYVYPPSAQGQRIPYAPGLMLLTGTLSVGGRDEADGRISQVRLALDPPGLLAGWTARIGVACGTGAAVLALLVGLRLLVAALKRGRHSFALQGGGPRETLRQSVVAPPSPEGSGRVGSQSNSIPIA